MIRYASLSSSSNYGNSYLIEGPDGTRVLVDYGARQRRLECGLASLGVDPAAISAILLTHEHSDHTYCLGLRRPLLARNRVPLYAHRAVWASCPAVSNYLVCCGEGGGGGLRDGGGGGLREGGVAERCLEPGRPVVIGSLEILPFATPHDAARPLGFVFSDGSESLGLATDLGHVSAEVARRLCGCTHLIIESNHDREMELRSGRPWPLIQRVLGNDGHLANDQAARALSDLIDGRTLTILLAHLSLECNTPELAVAAAEGVVRPARWPGVVRAAPPASPSGWLGA